MHLPPRTILTLGILVSALAAQAGTVAVTDSKAKPAPAIESNPFCFFNEQLCFDVQERARVEIRDNNYDFFNGHNDKTDDTWLLNRFRLGVLWKPTPWLRFYAQGQDSREFESKRPNIPGALGAEGDDNFDLRQAYVELGSPGFPLSLRAGRQLLAYGEERLIGVSDWNNFARSFDAVKLSYKQPGWQLDAFASSVVVIRRDSFDQSDLFNGNEVDREQVFSGLYFTHETPFGGLDLYALWLSQANGTVSNVESGLPTVEPKGSKPGAQHSSFGTYGGRIYGDPQKLHGFEFGVEGAYQNGEVRDLALNAFATHIGLGYNFDTLLKPRLWVEYNYASGDNHAGDNSTETFQNLFPTNHKFYGYMDLFSWQNLHNPEISLRVSPLKNVTAELDYHGFLARLDRRLLVPLERPHHRSPAEPEREQLRRHRARFRPELERQPPAQSPDGLLPLLRRRLSRRHRPLRQRELWLLHGDGESLSRHDAGATWSAQSLVRSDAPLCRRPRLPSDQQQPLTGNIERHAGEAREHAAAEETGFTRKNRTRMEAHSDPSQTLAAKLHFRADTGRAAGRDADRRLPELRVAAG